MIADVRPGGCTSYDTLTDAEFIRVLERTRMDDALCQSIIFRLTQRVEPGDDEDGATPRP